MVLGFSAYGFIGFGVGTAWFKSTLGLEHPWLEREVQDIVDQLSAAVSSK